MSLVMLINASRTEEVRAAIVRDKVLENLEIEPAHSHLVKGNIYKGSVANTEASLNAAFVEIGTGRQGFLPVDAVDPRCYHDKPRKEGKARIEEVLRRRGDIIVQVTRDSIGSKGPALTTNVSLAGRYVVLMPYDSSRGISRKLEDDKKRKAIKETVAKLKVPEGVGFIVRTAGLDATKTALNRDVAALVKLWKRVQTESTRAKAPALLYRDGDLVLRMIRDYFSSDFDELVVDTEAAAERARTYFRTVMPRTKVKVTLHTDRTPLFTAYGVEKQIDTIHERRVRLPSGGTIVIDPTEALTAIDVNSGKMTRERSQEETALKTNLESAREIARQLRLRDLGGLVVVDFIDMASRGHNRQVERAVKDAVKPDKARIYLGKISDNGLMEINRQRIKQALQVRTHRECPTCGGAGAIPSPEFVAMQIVRRVDARASSGNLAEVHVDLHPELADYLQNHFRRDLEQIEREGGLKVFVHGRPGLHRNEQNISYKDHPPGSRKQAARSKVVEAAGSRVDDAGGKGESQRSRKKGDADGKTGRRGKRGDAPKAVDAGVVNGAAGEADEGPQRKGQADTAEPKPKRTRSARRSRSRKGGTGRDDGPGRAEGTTADAAPAAGAKASGAPAPEAKAAEGGPPPAGDRPLTRSQKRRLRRKRKKDRERQAQLAIQQGGRADTPDGGSPVDGDPTVAEPTEAIPGGDAPADREPPAGSADAPPDAPAAADAPDADAHGDDAADVPAKPRSRRGRGRGRSKPAEAARPEQAAADEVASAAAASEPPSPPRPSVRELLRALDEGGIEALEDDTTATPEQAEPAAIELDAPGGVEEAAAPPDVDETVAPAEVDEAAAPPEVDESAATVTDLAPVAEPPEADEPPAPADEPAPTTARAGDAADEAPEAPPRKRKPRARRSTSRTRGGSEKKTPAATSKPAEEPTQLEFIAAPDGAVEESPAPADEPPPPADDDAEG